MVIIKADILLENEKIHNEMPYLLERVSLSNRVLIDNLKFHAKSRSRFDLLSTTYLITQIFFLQELQVNYLQCSYDIEKNKFSCLRKMVQ